MFIYQYLGVTKLYAYKDKRLFFLRFIFITSTGIEDSSSRFVKLQNVKLQRSLEFFALLNSILVVAINVIDIKMRAWFLVYQSQMLHKMLVVVGENILHFI